MFFSENRISLCGKVDPADHSSWCLLWSGLVRVHYADYCARLHPLQRRQNPGTLHYRRSVSDGALSLSSSCFQLLDLPGIIEGAKDGKGRGRQVIAVARTCSLIFIVLDVLKPLGHKKIIERELEGFGIRLNKQPPNIGFRKKDKGGVNLQTLVSPTKTI